MNRSRSCNIPLTLRSFTASYPPSKTGSYYASIKCELYMYGHKVVVSGKGCLYDRFSRSPKRYLRTWNIYEGCDRRSKKTFIGIGLSLEHPRCGWQLCRSNDHCLLFGNVCRTNFRSCNYCNTSLP